MDITREKIFILVILLISIAVHEYAHCWTADRLGDDTPRQAGRVTLNPLAHLDVMGTIMIFASLFMFKGFGIGWGKPSPMNPFNFEHPARDRMLTAVAGPISNLLQMLVWASLGLLIQWVALNLLIWHPNGIYVGNGDVQLPSMVMIALYAGDFCRYGVIVNAALAAFNLLPVYPLDGHHILSYLLPPSLRPIVDNPAWMGIFLVLVFSGAARYVYGPMMIAAVSATNYLIGWPGAF